MVGSLVLSLFVLHAAAFGDQEAVAVHNKLVEKLQAAKAISCTVEVRSPSGAISTITYKALKPNHFSILTASYEVWSDGQKRYTYVPERKEYQVAEAPKSVTIWFPGLEGFGSSDLGNLRAASLSEVEFEGALRQALHYEVLEPQSGRVTVYLSKSSGLPVGAKQVASSPDKPSDQSAVVYVYKDLRLDPLLSAKEFAWIPPKDAKPFEPPNYEAKLLKVGTTAPSFTLRTPEGKELSLEQALKGNRATLVNFWFYG